MVTIGNYGLLAISVPFLVDHKWDKVNPPGASWVDSFNKRWDHQWENWERGKSLPLVIMISFVNFYSPLPTSFGSKGFSSKMGGASGFGFTITGQYV